MQEGNKSLGMLQTVQFGRKIFALSTVAYITVGKLVSDLFQAGSTLVGSKSIKRASRLSEKPRNITNSLETFPYAIQKYLALHQSNITLQTPS